MKLSITWLSKFKHFVKKRELPGATSYQRWVRDFPKLTPLRIQWMRWRKQSIPSRPYLLAEFGHAGFDVGGFVAFVGLGALIFGYGRLLLSPLMPKHNKAIKNVATAVVDIAAFPVQRAIEGTQTRAAQIGVTVTPTMALETPTMTATGFVSKMGTIIPNLQVTAATVVPGKFGCLGECKFVYSWYNPKLGPPNCWQWNDKLKKCMSRTADGSKFNKWWGRGLACPVEYPLGTVFRVLAPKEIKGDWRCIDRGGIVTGNILDFLQQQGVLPWFTELTAITILPP